MTEKQIIEDITESLSLIWGPYQLARKIHTRDFVTHTYRGMATRVNRSFYSILSVIRRYRAKQQRPQPMYS